MLFINRKCLLRNSKHVTNIMLIIFSMYLLSLKFYALKHVSSRIIQKSSRIQEISCGQLLLSIQIMLMQVAKGPPLGILPPQRLLSLSWNLQVRKWSTVVKRIWYNSHTLLVLHLGLKVTFPDSNFSTPNFESVSK